MTWIKTLGYDEADSSLRILYDRLMGPSGHVDNIMAAHSLRPHTMKGHMTLYKYALHHPQNTVPKWFLECLGVYTSMLNKCGYCVDHHAAGMARLLDNEIRTSDVLAALSVGGTDDLHSDVLTTRELAALRYARLLTLTPAVLVETDIAALRDSGWNDAEILEINQVVSYFAYANRTVLGLGVNTKGDVLGTSPGDLDDPDNWVHR